MPRLRSKYAAALGLDGPDGPTGPARRKQLSKVYERNRKEKLGQVSRQSKYENLPEVQAVKHKPHERKQVLAKLYRQAGKVGKSKHPLPVSDKPEAAPMRAVIAIDGPVIGDAAEHVGLQPPCGLIIAGQADGEALQPAMLPASIEEDQVAMFCHCSAEMEHLKQQILDLEAKNVSLNKDMVFQGRVLRWHQNVRDWVSSVACQAMSQRSVNVPPWLVLQGQRLDDDQTEPESDMERSPC
ncbi:unnamed protein product [Effrenium voratum]|nr:unnamed protein product [Effrenium voratum]